MVLRVAVSDVLELELAVEADKPACETEEELCERRVDVEVVFSRDVVCCKLSEVYFIKSTCLAFSTERGDARSVRVLTRLGLGG